MEIRKIRNKSAMDCLNATYSNKEDFFTTQKHKSNNISFNYDIVDKEESKIFRGSKELSLLKICKFQSKLDSVQNQNIEKLNSSYKRATLIEGIKNSPVIPSLDLKKKINTNLNIDILSEKIETLQSIIKKKDELINNINKENMDLREKLFRIKNKLKKFVHSYKALKSKLDNFSKINAMNLSTEVKKDLSSKTLDLTKKIIIHNSSNDLSNIEITNNQSKYDDSTLINNNDSSSNSIIVTESDFTPIKKLNKLAFVCKSVENRNEEFSFRSFDNIPHFLNGKHEKATITGTIIHDGLHTSKKETKEILDLIKYKTKNILEIYQKKVENFKFLIEH